MKSCVDTVTKPASFELHLMSTFAMSRSLPFGLKLTLMVISRFAPGSVLRSVMLASTRCNSSAKSSERAPPPMVSSVTFCMSILSVSDFLADGLRPHRRQSVPLRARDHFDRSPGPSASRRSAPDHPRRRDAVGGASPLKVMPGQHDDARGRPRGQKLRAFLGRLQPRQPQNERAEIAGAHAI